MVNLSDIGLDDNALFCYTNLTTCCRGVYNPSGRTGGAWRFPNNAVVDHRYGSTSSVFSRSRTEHAILLHRGNSTLGPTGIFTCEIPDSSSKDQNVNFDIYDFITTNLLPT